MNHANKYSQPLNGLLKTMLLISVVDTMEWIDGREWQLASLQVSELASQVMKNRTSWPTHQKDGLVTDADTFEKRRERERERERERKVSKYIQVGNECKVTLQCVIYGNKHCPFIINNLPTNRRAKDLNWPLLVHLNIGYSMFGSNVNKMLMSRENGW